MKSIKVLCLILTFTPIFIEYDNISRIELTPLHQAVTDGDIVQVKKLISSGIYVNALNIAGNTPLHLAAQNGYNNIIEFLIASGADINIKNMSGRTPLHYSSQRGHYETSELLITKGAIIDVRNSSDGTPLHYACNAGHEDMVELLLAHGADINEQGQSGVTPLHGAVINGNKNIVELLILKGADINIKDKMQPTIYMYNYEDKKQFDLMQNLYTRGPKINIDTVENLLGFAMPTLDSHLAVLQMRANLDQFFHPQKMINVSMERLVNNCGLRALCLSKLINYYGL